MSLRALSCGKLSARNADRLLLTPHCLFSSIDEAEHFLELITSTMHSLPTIAATLLLSGLSGASALPRFRGATELRKRDKPTKKKVIVIGAGVSGLTTALALQMQGHDVRILEYQDRVGGRLWSADLEYGDAVTELGGGHFRSNMPLTLAYVDYYGLNKKLVVMNDGLPRYQTGDLVGQASDLTSLAKWKLHQNETNVTPTSLMNYYLSKSGLNTIRVLDADFPNAQEQEKFDTMTLKDMFRDAGASQGLVQILEAHGGESIRLCISHESAAGIHLNSHAKNIRRNHERARIVDVR